MVRLIEYVERVRIPDGRFYPADLGIRVSNGKMRARRVRETSGFVQVPHLGWDIRAAKRMREAGVSYREIARLLGVNHHSQILRDLRRHARYLAR